MSYQRVGVASTFSPTFAAVLAEADGFTRHCGANLEIVHAAAHDGEKERRFREALGEEIEIRWVEGETPARAITRAAKDFSYELLIAGALQKEDDERSFTSGVARELLGTSACDLLLLPRPLEEPGPLQHVVFALEPGEDADELLRDVLRVIRPQRITLTVTETPFAAAIAASRGEEPADTDAWLEDLVHPLSDKKVEIETRVVASNTGYNLCDTIQGIEADLLVVKAVEGKERDALPVHMNWLYQVIPTRLLVVR